MGTTTDSPVTDAPKTAARGDAGPALTYLVKNLELAVRDELDTHLREVGLTTQQYAALSILDRQPGLSSAQLARRSFVTPQSMQTMVRALEDAELITRSADPENQRVLRIELTGRGEQIFHAARERATAVEERMLTGVGPAQSETLRALLTRCAHNLRSLPPPA